MAVDQQDHALPAHGARQERRIAGITALIVEYGIALYELGGAAFTRDYLKAYGVGEDVINRVLTSPGQRRGITGLLSSGTLLFDQSKFCGAERKDV
jgi:hypothetical protein